MDELLKKAEYGNYTGKERGTIQMTEETKKRLNKIKESIIVKGMTSILIPFDLVKAQFGHKYKYLHSYVWQFNQKIKKAKIGIKLGETHKRLEPGKPKEKYVRFFLFPEWENEVEKC